MSVQNGMVPHKMLVHYFINLNFKYIPITSKLLVWMTEFVIHLNTQNFALKYEIKNACCKTAKEYKT